MRIGARLVQAGVINESQLEAGLRMQGQYGGRLASNLIELRYVEVDVVARALGQQLGVPAALQKHFDLVDRSVTARLAGKIAQKLEAIPLGYSTKQTNTLIVVFADPRNLSAIDEVAFIVRARVQASVAPEARIRQCLDRFYGIRAKSRFFVQMDTPAGEPVDATVQGLAESQAAMISGGNTLSLPPLPLPPPPLPISAESARARAAASAPHRPPSNDALVVTIPLPAVERERPPTSERTALDLAAPPQRAKSHPPAQLEAPDLPPPSRPMPQSARTAERTSSQQRPAIGPPPMPTQLEAPPQSGTRPLVETPRAELPNVEGLRSRGAEARAVEAPSPVSAARPLSRAPPPARPPLEERAALSANDAIAALELASTRDEIGDAIADFLRSCFAAGLVLIARNDIALGWKGFAIDVDPAVIGAMAVPLTTTSMLSVAYDAGSLFRGAPPSEGAAIHARIFKLLGAAPPREVVVVPIALNDRVVNLVYGHPFGGGVIAASAVADLTHVCTAAAAAYVRLIQSTRDRSTARG